MSTITEFASSRELFMNLTLRELRGKYKRSVLGWAWSMLNPLATMAIFSLVFRFFLKIEVPAGDPSGMEIFALFLLCGLLPFNFFSLSLSGGMGSLVGNSNLVKKVWFRRELLVASNTASAAVGFLIELGVLAVALMIFGNFVLPWLVPALYFVFLEVLFVMGLALIAAVINVYFRDLEHLIGIALQILFYSAPIIYPISLVEDAMVDHPTLLTLYNLNPITRFVGAFRSLLYDLAWPSLETTLYLTGVSVGSLLLGVFVFARFEGRLAEEL